MSNPLTFLPEKCTGCHLCSLACSGTRSGFFSSTMANIGIVSKYSGDSFERGARLCTHCGTCVENCPTGALEDSGRMILFDRKKCSTCGVCAEVCPEKVIYIHKGYPVLCNLCDGVPWCARMCPREAILFEEVRP